ncbi:MAG: lipopolysaccharide heptosyltransferase II [Deltaproteobacteria bacterium RBG_16_48_10]|nr:MAG: lipopolysaccharide heptosyltransferase II [Deltaproteobacteria bacterium RBG_16_48_10]
MKADFEKIDRILVRAVNWVGDTVLTYPAVQRLKTRFPRSHLAILVRDNLVDLWKTFPYVDEVIPFQPRGGWRSPWEDLRLGSSLRKRKFDLAVVFPRSFRSAYQVYLARVPIRLGYQDKGRFLFLTHGIPRTEEIHHVHRVHYYQKLIDPFGKGEGLNSPKIFLRNGDRNWADEKLNGLNLLDGRPLIGMNPGATYGLAKCWFPDRFGQLGKRLAQKWKASILLFGKAEEKSITQEILQHLGEGGVDLTGKTNLLQLAAILGRCQLLVTNDTGTMHVATAVGTPVLAIFGPTDPITTGPCGESHVVVRKELSCSPCLKRICPIDHQCMSNITVDEVEEIIHRRLEGVGR